MTKYDLKQQHRQQPKKKEGGIQLFAAACAALLVFCIGVFAWQTYQNYKEKNATYVMIGEHEIKKAEYDYYFHSSINTLYASYGSYLSYMGLDLSSDLSTQYYTDTMTWQDYFDQQAVAQLQQVYALCEAAEEAGFEHDATEDVNDFVEAMEEAATSVSYSTSDYIKASYGNFVTLKEAKKFVANDSLANAYYEKLSEDTEITEDEITAYYEENKENYDSVDYLTCAIEAVIPETEVEEVETDAAETEAETTEETETTDATEAAETEEASEETESETLSEEEQAEKEAQEAAIKAAALEEAENKANEMAGKLTDAASFETLAETYATDSEAEVKKENVKKSSVSVTEMAEWLFAEERQAGDVTVIADETNETYYVVYFSNRYLDETKTVDVRHILVPFEETTTTDDMTEEEIAEAEEKAKEKALAEAESIFDEWQEGEATEDSFATLAEEKSTDTGSNTNGGLYEGVAKDQMVEAFNDWIFDEVRQPGDTDIVETEYGYHIMYYVADNAAAWHLSVESTLRSEKMQAYIEELIAAYEVVDENNNIAYLHVDETTDETTEGAGTETDETTTEVSTEAASEETAEAIVETSAETTEE